MGKTGRKKEDYEIEECRESVRDRHSQRDKEIQIGKNEMKLYVYYITSKRLKA